MDTWYGHSYDGINLWLSIDGVNVDNTVILYPDMFGRPVEFDPVSMYLASGVQLTAPHKIALKPGELLVFNPEVLHGTQVNISGETRVALTTRVNPAEPRFSANAAFHMEHWYSSEDVKRRRFSSVKLFSVAEHEGEPSMEPRPRYEDPRTSHVRIDRKLEDAPVPLCSAADLKPGHKMIVDLANAKLLLTRRGAEIRAFRRVCPHLGVDLADGSHDGDNIYCPGHGVAFSLDDGQSKCEAFKLKAFHAYEANGSIFVQRAPAAVNDDVEAEVVNG
jgi:nitrite reductase/ring-hydroxylating ferredoxin subunit